MTGAVVVMWLGELITARGIGNGMSIIIFISIVSRIPGGAAKLFTMSVITIILFLVIALAVVVGVDLDHHRRAARAGAVRQAGGRAAA